MKTTIKIIYAKELFDDYDNADEVRKIYLFIELKGKCRPGVDQEISVITYGLFPRLHS